MRALSTLLLFALAATRAAAADLPFFGRVTFDVRATAQAVDVRRTGDKRPHKFEEHAEYAEGFALDDLRVDSVNAGRRSFLNLVAREAGQADQQFAAEAGVFGTWRGALTFAGFPRLFTSSTRSPFGYMGAGRLTIDEAVRRELTFATNEDLAHVVERVATRAPLLRVGYHRTRIAAAARWLPFDWLAVRATARDETRNGTRPFSTGRFDETPGGFAIELFELAEPLEMRTTELVAGTTLRGASWHVDADASFMRFRNTITDLHYDNPFRMTEGIATAPPDSAARMLRVSAQADLGTRAVASLSAAWTAMTQDQRLAPWTINHAIEGSGLPPGMRAVNVEALPRASLKGKANVFTTDDSLALLLTRNATLTFRYRDYDFANETPEMRMPGYAGGGDTFWRTELRGQPIAAVPLSYRRQTGQSELAWSRGRLRARLGYERESVTREQQQTVRTARNGFTAAVNYRREDLVASAALRRSDQTGGEAMRFDAATRTRDDARFRVQWTPGERFAAAASFSTVADDYGRRPLGMRRFAVSNASVDVRMTLSNESALTARVTRESTAYEYAQPGWERAVDDGVTSAALEYDVALGRLSLHAAYERSAARQSISDRPEIESTLQDVRAEAEYELTPRWQVGMRYRHEPYALDDYATDVVSVHPDGALSGDADARRMLLLDARYSDHAAHVLAVYFRLESD